MHRIPLAYLRYNLSRGTSKQTVPRSRTTASDRHLETPIAVHRRSQAEDEDQMPRSDFVVAAGTRRRDDVDVVLRRRRRYEDSRRCGVRSRGTQRRPRKIRRPQRPGQSRYLLRSRTLRLGLALFASLYATWLNQFFFRVFEG